MGYNANYGKLLQARQPFQITKSNEIHDRNKKMLIQEGKMRVNLLKRNNNISEESSAALKAEQFIQRICKMN